MPFAELEPRLRVGVLAACVARVVPLFEIMSANGGTKAARDALALAWRWAGGATVTEEERTSAIRWVEAAMGSEVEDRGTAVRTAGRVGDALVHLLLALDAPDDAHASFALEQAHAAVKGFELADKNSNDWTEAERAFHASAVALAEASDAGEAVERMRGHLAEQAEPAWLPLLEEEWGYERDGEP